MPQKNIIHLTATEMEIKFVECNMEQVLRGCDCERIQREDYGQPMKKKREHGYVYSKNLKSVCVLYHFDDPDGTERRLIQYMETDTDIYILKEFGSQMNLALSSEP